MRSCSPSASMISVADWFMVKARRGAWVYVVETPQLSIVTGKSETSEAAVAGAADSATTAAVSSAGTRLVIRIRRPSLVPAGSIGPDPHGGDDVEGLSGIQLPIAERRRPIHLVGHVGQVEHELRAAPGVGGAQVEQLVGV